jgi:predicted HTH transcriptional regulator
VERYRPIIYAEREDRNREFKRSFAWTRRESGETMAKVTKTILAMSNLRDGGHIVIGVEEIPGSGGRYEPKGVTHEHLQAFSHDDVADWVRDYADPPALFDCSVVTLDGMDFFVIAVSAFEEFPVICTRSYAEVLSEGAVYVRSRSGRPRSEPVSRYVDMRELLDLAVERGVRRFYQMQAIVFHPGPSDAERFEQQLGDFS